MPNVYLDSLKTGTPQNEPIPGREGEMSLNNAGGYTFDVDDWTRLERFLILGTEGGTYYVDVPKLTRDNSGVVLRCIREDGVRVVNRIVEISDGGLAPKNDPAIFALALAAKNGDNVTRSLAYKSVPKVCRIGTHIFQFVAAIDAVGGWGRGARQGVSKWYTEQSPERLGLQLVKYRNRESWVHRDVLRVAHPNPSEGNAALLAYAAGKYAPEGHYYNVTDLQYLPAIVVAYETAKTSTVEGTVKLIREYNLPRECVNTEFLTDPQVQEALLYNSPLTALIRNLSNYTKSGVLTPFSDGTKRVVELLSNEESLRKSRVHPMGIYMALCQYSEGHGLRGSGQWKPVQAVLDALDEAFYAAMGNVTPSGVKTLHVIDNSGSMDSGYHGADYKGLKAPISMATAMAMVAVRTEGNMELVVCNTQVHPAALSKTMRLDAAVKYINSLPKGGTDLAKPFEYLQTQRYDVDAVVTLTDDETWAGKIHPAQALANYRRSVGHGVKNVIMSMVPTAHSIGDHGDSDTLQLVGLDSSAPAIITGFLRGEL